MIPPVSPAPPSSDPVLAANKKLVSRLFLEIVNGHAYAVADEIFAPDFRWPQLGLVGPEGVKAWARAFHAGFPDAHDRIDWQIAEGPWVASLVTVSGTQHRPLARLSAERPLRAMVRDRAGPGGGRPDRRARGAVQPGRCDARDGEPDAPHLKPQKRTLP